MDFLVQRAKDKHRRSVLFMLSDVLGTHSSICHQWCATWLVLLSYILLVQKVKINMSEVYYSCPGMYEAKRLLYFLFLTSGAPLDCSYSPVFLPTPGTEGQNTDARSVLFIPSDIWVTGNGNLLICHQWCATWFVLFSLPCLLMVQWTKTNISDVYYLCPVMYETEIGNLSICHQWCATLLVLFSRFFLAGYPK